MQIIRSLDRLPRELTRCADLIGGAVAIGNFDGVHLGHARLVERLVAQARRVGGPAVVFTFDPHPLAILKPEWLPTPMTRVERKAELLGQLDVDAVIAYPTDQALLSLTPREFFDRILRERLQAQAIVEGPNFHFGKNREGDVMVLQSLCDEVGITLEVVEPLAWEGTWEGEAPAEPLSGSARQEPRPPNEPNLISSSRVRKLIQSGSIVQANELLTQPYRLSGVVGHGAERGRTIGFPTANLKQIETVIPAPGVYAGRAWVDDQPYAAAINIGPNPTFGEQTLKIEVHLIDFAGNLYDRPLSVDLLNRLRDIRPFPTVDALVAQLHQDIAEAKAEGRRQKAEGRRQRSEGRGQKSEVRSQKSEVRRSKRRHAVNPLSTMVGWPSPIPPYFRLPPSAFCLLLPSSLFLLPSP